MNKSKSIVSAIFAIAVIAGCGGSDTSSSQQPDTTDAVVDVADGFAIVSPDDAAAIIDDPPADLVVLDVRTPEEFAEGHIEGAIMVDFYQEDFDAQLASLDPDVPYLVYCRSGNRSGQTISKMKQIGFASVTDIDGGILAWTNAGLPLVE